TLDLRRADSGFLQVTPDTGLTSIGTPGGPFSEYEQVYTLTNTGDTALLWSASASAPWLTLSNASGSLEPDAAAQVVARINPSANALPAGVYAETITFVNRLNGNGTTTRTVLLTVS